MIAIVGQFGLWRRNFPDHRPWNWALFRQPHHRQQTAHPTGLKIKHEYQKPLDVVANVLEPRGSNQPHWWS
jgi:hypothetical protein